MSRIVEKTIRLKWRAWATERFSGWVNLSDVPKDVSIGLIFSPKNQAKWIVFLGELCELEHSGRETMTFHLMRLF